MNNQMYEYVDYDIDECINLIGKWMQANITEISTGNMWVNSIHIEKESSENIYHPKRWSLKINYSEKE